MKFIKLSRGNHKQGLGVGCAMEAVSALNGEMWTDQPECVDPVIGAFVRGVNDAMPDDQTRAKYLSPRLIYMIGTRGTLNDSIQRAYIVADFAIHKFAPIALHAAGLHAEAEKLEALEKIVDPMTAKRAAGAAGWAAGSAAR